MAFIKLESQPLRSQPRRDRILQAARLPRVAGIVVIATSVWLVCACSMATSIQRDALDYNAGVANYNDQMLIYTILRARDDAPINLLALSTINGAVSVQGTLGATAGYKTVAGTNFAASVAPGIQASSSPTWSMASLNTQGFTLGIIQPISPMYIVSKWSTGLDREFLLRLFIKSINLKEANGYHEYLNDPNSPVAMAAFSAKLHSWLPGISMRALTVLEPLGPTLDPSTVTSVSTTSEGGTKSARPSRIESSEVANAANASLLGAYEYLMPLGGGSFYVGNAAPRTAGGSLRLQLYREYPQQVVLCVPRSKLGIEPLASSGSSTPLGVEQEEDEALSNYALALKAAAKGGAGKTSEPPPSNTSGGTGAGANGNSSPHPQPVGSLASNLKADRVAAVLPIGACGQHELVLPAYTEEQNARDSGTYSHVEWRSIAEVIDYLGALLRAKNAEAGRWTDSDASGAATSHALFRLSSEQPGFTQVTYRGIRYAIHTNDERDAAAPQDHSLQALSLLNELVSAAKVSSDIPNTQEIQFVP
jgi:hypothetical protein